MASLSPNPNRRCFLKTVFSLSLLNSLGLESTIKANAATTSVSDVKATSEIFSAQEKDHFFVRYFDRMNAPKPLKRFTSKQQWIAYKEQLQTKVLDCLGLNPMPPRLPLNARVTREIVQEGIIIQRVWFQVLPEIYASGWLYTDKSNGNLFDKQTNKVRLPAILNPHGHWEDGAINPVVQTRCLALAKLGYVAFSPDSTHVIDLPIGLCPIGQMTWNNMRAIDLLTSLPGVDTTRIGCTGASGGGQQAMYLTAIDDRIQVSVPAVLVSYFRRILFSTAQAHCNCNHAPGIAGLTDETELAAMFAPRPQRFITASGDWTRDFHKQEFPEIQHIYNLMGGSTDCVPFDKPHNYDRDSREAMYEWMNRHLQPERKLSKVSEPNITPVDVNILKAMAAPPSELKPLNAASEWYRKHYRVVINTDANWETVRPECLKRLNSLLGEPETAMAPHAVSRGEFTWAGFSGEKWLINTEPEVQIPTVVLAMPAGSKTHSTLIVVHPDGKEALLKNHAFFIRNLLETGCCLVCPDIRLRGELKRDWRWNAVIWGRPETGMAAHDLNQLNQWIGSRNRSDALMVLGMGDAGLDALCATALRPLWKAAFIDSYNARWVEMNESPKIPRIMRWLDLSQIAALAAPATLWVNGTDVPSKPVEKAYQHFEQISRYHRTNLATSEFHDQVLAWIRSNTV